MSKALVDKLTNRMTWILVIPTAVLIFSLACLAGSFTWVALHANKVSFDGLGGKFTAEEINAVNTQIQNALTLVDQQQNRLSKIINQLEKPPLKAAHTAMAMATHQTLENMKERVIDLSDVITNLKIQSTLLQNQKKNLTEANTSLQQLKEDLNNLRYSSATKH